MVTGGASATDTRIRLHIAEIADDGFDARHRLPRGIVACHRRPGPMAPAENRSKERQRNQREAHSGGIRNERQEHPAKQTIRRLPRVLTLDLGARPLDERCCTARRTGTR